MSYYSAAMASDVALYLRKKFLASLSSVKKTHFSDPTFRRFEKIRNHLGDDTAFLTAGESISLLHELNDALADWLILKGEKINNVIIDEAQMNKVLSCIESRLIAHLKTAQGSTSTGLAAAAVRNVPADRSTVYYDSDSFDILGFDEHVQTMSNYLWDSGEGFKAVGIYGMGGSGKTALVKRVLKHETVPGKFDDKLNNIIWISLSEDSSSKRDETDIKISKQILHDLGFDFDNKDHDDDNGWCMKQVELELHKLRNYVLVLDDVWHCSDWLTGLFHTLAKNNNGGAVIVTSRIEQVARKIVGGGENSSSLVIYLNPWRVMRIMSF